ncbi:MAG: TrmH family RNA methyltransferase, partial [Clostridia bacterium]
LLFGKETKGLPEDLLHDNYDRALRVPMRSEMRSLNLSNTVCLVVYELLRQNDFEGLSSEGHLTKFK